MRQQLTLTAVALLALGWMVPANADQPPSAEQYYSQAVEAMRNVPQPKYATYDVHVHITGLGFELMREPDGKASIDLTLSGGKPDTTFPAAYRKSDDLTSVLTPQGWGIVRSPIFDPTWNGVEDWIRYGWSGRSDSATAPPSPTPDANGLPVIAAVRAMGVAFYNVSDGGAATCANGDPAHRVHLIARKDPLDHPLTDAVIDERTTRFCSVRFEMRQSIVAVGYTFTTELNIADVDGESLVRNGTMDFVGRAVGIGVKRVTMTFAYDRFAFPPTLDDARATRSRSDHPGESARSAECSGNAPAGSKFHLPSRYDDVAVARLWDDELRRRVRSPDCAHLGGRKRRRDAEVRDHDSREDCSER
jgi:hypothetical protein